MTRDDKHLISRYKSIQKRFDNDLWNNNWYLVDTSKIQSGGKYNYVDLFAGCGGISVGFRNAGLEKKLSVELEKPACDTLQLNFQEIPVFCGDIKGVSKEYLDNTLGKEQIDIICGGPPCQGFSVAGLRNPNDPRNQLFKEYIRIVKERMPYFIVLENVPGILTMQGGDVYKEILSQFESLGYNVSIRILEAADYGVPQLRTRAVFVGNRLGLKNPYPKPLYEPKNYLSIESAIGDIKNKERDPSFDHERTAHSEKFEERISKVKPGDSLYETFRDAYKRQRLGYPSMTVKENHGGCHIHYEKNRVLSAREMARLQTFPDDFKFCGGMKKAYRQIGNAVPCKMAEHLGKAIQYELDQYFKNR